MKHFTIKTYINILLVISVILTAFLTQAGTVQSYHTSGDDPFETVVLPVQALSLNSISGIQS